MITMSTASRILPGYVPGRRLVDSLYVNALFFVLTRSIQRINKEKDKSARVFVKVW